MTSRDPHRPSAAARGAVTKMVPAGDQCRCSCGSMLARVVEQGLELKCRKCKSLVMITHDELVAMYQGLDFTPSVRLPFQPPRPR